MGDIYLSVIRNRHSDPVYKLFWDKEEAIYYTKGEFRDILAHEDGLREDISDDGVTVADFWYEYESDTASVVRMSIPAKVTNTRA